MQIFTEPARLSTALVDSIRSATRIRGAVAQADVRSKVCEELRRHSAKIEAFVVGLDAEHTDPEFIRSFEGHDAVRYMTPTRGTFHPVVYFFELPDGRTRCFVGSANLTGATFSRNSEVCVQIESEDADAEAVFDRLRGAIDRWWNRAKRRFSPDELDRYASKHRHAQARHATAGAPNGVHRDSQNGRGGRSGDGTPALLDCELVAMSWTQYRNRVRRALRPDTPDSFERRLEVVAEAQRLLADHHFAELDPKDQLRIAGVVLDDADAKWRAFGSMRGAGAFRRAIAENPHAIGDAIRAIPGGDAPVAEEHFTRYHTMLRRAFPENGHGLGIATLTRFAAMRRPDFFVCVTCQNRRRLTEGLGVPRTIEPEQYWGTVVTRIHGSPWWNTPRPKDPVDGQLWDARAAFLDPLSIEEQ